MGPEDALEAVSYLNPKITIPIHYNTFPVIQQKSSNIRRASSWRESIKPRRDDPSLGGNYGDET